MNKISRLVLLLMLSLHAAAVDPLVYTAHIGGVPEGDLRDTLTELSDTIATAEDPPASLAHLRRRVARDEARFLKALHSEAYYGAAVEAEIDDQREPVRVIFQISAGEQYVLALRNVVLDGEAPLPTAPAPEALGLNEGAPATAPVILDAERALLQSIRDQGHPFPVVGDREVIVDHDLHTADVTFHVTPGPRAVFGEVRIGGLTTIDESVVLNQIPWKQGEMFKEQILEDTQEELYQTNLFSVVSVASSEVVDEQGRLDVNVEVTERKHRTIAGGIEYESDEGAGANFRWEHRNIGGLGRRLTVGSRFSQRIYNLEVGYDIPFFRRDDQALAFDFEVADEETDAFSSQRIVSNVWVERELSEKLKLGVGFGVRVSQVEQLRTEQQFRLISFPVQLNWDNSDNPLNPTTGNRLRLLVAPYIDAGGGSSNFLSAELNYSHYFRLDEEADWVLATRARLGVIGAQDISDIPPDIRFYAGGGGSVRGYPYQSIGPQFGGDPTGGRSVIEGAVELRRRINESLGLAVFVDGAMVYAPTIPDFESEPRFGAGLGVRYFTPIGPLRVDLAVPLNPPEHVDERFQFYVSVGQAF